MKSIFHFKVRRIKSFWFLSRSSDGYPFKPFLMIRTPFLSYIQKSKCWAETIKPKLCAFFSWRYCTIFSHSPCNHILQRLHQHTDNLRFPSPFAVSDTVHMWVAVVHIRRELNVQPFSDEIAKAVLPEFVQDQLKARPVSPSTTTKLDFERYWIAYLLRSSKNLPFKVMKKLDFQGR